MASTRSGVCQRERRACFLRPSAVARAWTPNVCGSGQRHYAVGPKTARCAGGVRCHGLCRPGNVLRRRRSERCSVSIDLRGKRFLFPRGDRGREEIADAVTAAGGTAVRVVVYRTAGPDEATAAAMRAEMRREDRRVVLFASPSAVEQFEHLFTAEEKGVSAPGTVVAVIGPTTGEAAGRCGLPCMCVRWSRRNADSSMRCCATAEARMHTV